LFFAIVLRATRTIDDKRFRLGRHRHLALHSQGGGTFYHWHCSRSTDNESWAKNTALVRGPPVRGCGNFAVRMLGRKKAQLSEKKKKGEKNKRCLILDGHRTAGDRAPPQPVSPSLLIDLESARSSWGKEKRHRGAQETSQSTKPILPGATSEAADHCPASHTFEKCHGAGGWHSGVSPTLGEMMKRPDAKSVYSCRHRQGRFKRPPLFPGGTAEESMS